MTLPALTPDDCLNLVGKITDWGADPRQVAADIRAGKIMLSWRVGAPPDQAPDLRALELKLADQLEEAASARSIDELAAAGYTHIAARCVPCRRTSCKPIVQLPASVRALTLLELAPRLKCQDCGTPPETANLSPWRASDAPGHPKPRSAA